jgi:hypothetical protein
VRGRSALSEEKASRPRRTREHVIAAQSVNYLEKFFIDKGHTTSRPVDDYGFDMVVRTFDEEGYRENGDICIQKASDAPRYSKDGSYVAVEIDVRHYRTWMSEPMPVFLVLYDARAIRAYWLYVQSHFKEDSGRRPKPGARSVVVRIPIANEFTPSTVDYAREKKALILDQFAREVEHHG